MERLIISPQMRTALEHLLSGYSEKEIAKKMGLSFHTVHVYVKQLYQRLDVHSRGELLALALDNPRIVARRLLVTRYPHMKRISAERTAAI